MKQDLDMTTFKKKENLNESKFAYNPTQNEAVIVLDEKIQNQKFLKNITIFIEMYFYSQRMSQVSI